jgi:hypothetical membrane protein
LPPGLFRPEQPSEIETTAEKFVRRAVLLLVAISLIAVGISVWAEGPIDCHHPATRGFYLLIFAGVVPAAMAFCAQLFLKKCSRSIRVIGVAALPLALLEAVGVSLWVAITIGVGCSD